MHLTEAFCYSEHGELSDNVLIVDIVLHVTICMTVKKNKASIFVRVLSYPAYE